MLNAIKEADTSVKLSPLKYNDTTKQTNVKTTPFDAGTITDINTAISTAKR